MAGIGNFLSSSQGQATMGGIGNMVDSFLPQQKVNQEFLERNKDIAAGMNRMDSIVGGLSNAAISSGNPFAMAAGVALKATNALSKSAQDEFGVVKDSGKAIAAGILNPIQGVATLLGQKKRREARDRFINTEVSSNLAETREAGNVIINSLPEYKAPGYGKHGMKISTRFSVKHGKSKF